MRVGQRHRKCGCREGALTLLVGTSDEMARTSLAGQDLFRDPIGALRDLQPTGHHPLGFWKRVGYTVVGLVPDAEGPGKPQDTSCDCIQRAALSHRYQRTEGDDGDD